MAVTIRKATVADAPLIGQIRRIVWSETYRGIYPDEKIDRYDVSFHLERDTRILASDKQHFYLYEEDNRCVGYFSFGPGLYGPYKDFELCLNNLYICREYKGKGLGKQVFSILRAFAAEHGIPKFFCGCNAHNLAAQSFYRHMGGIEGISSTGHRDKSDDIVHFEFTTGDRV